MTDDSNNLSETVDTNVDDATNGSAKGSTLTPTGQRLRAYIDRIERLEESKKEVMEDIKEVFAEAKSDGFDVSIMRKVVAWLRKDSEKRDEEEQMIDTYKTALGLE